MSVAGGPYIVENGLVLCLDVANIKSYPGTGTTWTDISNNNHNGVLVNSPTCNGYGLSLNGTNQYAYISHSGALAFSNSNGFTVSVWHRNNDSNTTYNGIITNDYAGDNAWKIFRDNGQNNYQARSGSYTAAFPSYTVNMFHNYVYTFNGTSTMILYFNGNFVSSNTGGVPASQNYIAFGSYRYGDALSNTWLANQTLGPVALYNRALTPSEVLQNFNAQKSRFNL